MPNWISIVRLVRMVLMNNGFLTLDDKSGFRALGTWTSRNNWIFPLDRWNDSSEHEIYSQAVIKVKLTDRLIFGLFWILHFVLMDKIRQFLFSKFSPNPFIWLNQTFIRSFLSYTKMAKIILGFNIKLFKKIEFFLSWQVNCWTLRHSNVVVYYNWFKTLPDGQAAGQ